MPTLTNLNDAIVGDRVKFINDPPFKGNVNDELQITCTDGAIKTVRFFEMAIDGTVADVIAVQDPPPAPPPVTGEPPPKEDP